ncbi:peptidylprolyl isomerase [Parasulfitobacter algicola]|uniref:Parvulin-like PPIase n=1 Tax=Parasulfitobacter algicola TaxID=2614809 RepID=A0ABX2IUK2_9RHOB|nr:peptidylprolyl isomerase [Sulfitobacter algicola]NSX53878.1 peptidylprolyl isomerase [Sulfitobacter algicola]
MFKRHKLLAATILTAALVQPAFAQDAETTPETDVTAETVVTTINGQDITIGHLIIARTQLPQQFQQLPNDVLLEGLVDQLTQQALLSQSLDELPRRAEMALENERRSMLAGEVIQEVTGSAITDESVQKAYEDTYANAEPEREYQASHILVDSEEEAITIKAELDEGADFATLAAEKSTGPSGPNGGDLGWFGAGMMVAEFEEATFALEKDQVSDPVQTQFGWHVIKLVDSRLKSAPALDDVRSELEAQVQREAVDARIEELKSAAEITTIELDTIDPNVLQQYDLLQ